MSPDGLVERVTRPKDCVLGFGIPTSKERFIESGYYGPPGCFARKFKGNWHKYHAEVVEPYDRLGLRIRRLGARIVPDLSLGGYTDLLLDPGVHAVILFTHWSDDYIELRDGLVGVDAFIEAVPKTFAGVMDLCVCHPDTRRMIPLLRRKLPHSATIHYIDSVATPIFWLYFYRDLFLLLRRGTRTYLATSVELAEAYFDRSREIRS